MSTCACCSRTLEPEWAMKHNYCSVCFRNKCSAHHARCSQSEHEAHEENLVQEKREAHAES